MRFRQAKTSEAAEQAEKVRGERDRLVLQVPNLPPFLRISPLCSRLFLLHFSHRQSLCLQNPRPAVSISVEYRILRTSAGESALFAAQVEDLEARLLLAGTETVQDRLRDCEEELKIVQEDLLNTRCWIQSKKKQNGANCAQNAVCLSV